MPDPRLPPGVMRDLGEADAHAAEARRQLVELAKQRGVPPAPPLPNDFEEELITARHDIEELKARATMPSGELSVRAPGGAGVSVRGVSGGQLVAVVSALAVVAVIAAAAWLALR